MFVCNICQESFEDEFLYDIHHELLHHTDDTYADMDIENIFSQDVPRIQQVRHSVIQFAPPAPLSVELLAQALPRSVVRHFKINNANYSLNNFFEQAKNLIIQTLTKELERLNFIKFGILLDATFTNVQNEVSPRGFITKNKSIMATSDINVMVEDCLQELNQKIGEHEGRGSGWSLLSINALDIRVHKHGYGDRGSSHIPLPKKISNTKACVNVKNEDNECFRYAMLAKFVTNNASKPSRIYQELSNKYNFNGISYPVSLNDISKFENQNPSVSVNVFALDTRNNVFPLRIVKSERQSHTDLLLLKSGDISHYVYIKDFNALVAKQLTRNKERIVVCKRCFCFAKKKAHDRHSQWLLEHQRLCNKNETVQVKMPSANRAEIKFNKTSHQYRIPVVIYADFEASLIPLDTDELESDRRIKYQLHQPNSYCLIVKSTLSEEHLNNYGLSSKPQIYRGEQASEKFIDDLYDIAGKVEMLYENIVPMKDLTEDEVQVHSASVKCYLCNYLFTEENRKTHDHDHLTGFYRGPACNRCNINYKLPKFVPVIFHNLSGYDAHFIIPELGRDKGNIDVLATSTEKFISFSKKVGKIKLRFLDSFRFMSSSLMILTENLRKEDLVETKKIVPADKLDLVLRKGVFPYDYIDDLKRFEETSLPPLEGFYSKLNDVEISLEDYQHAQRVWNELDMKTLGEYSDFYVKLDVTLLCDVMEEFRNTCFSTYGLDPLHSYTAPGLAWQAMLKETQCTLELLTDVDMLLMIESGVRGGLCQSVTRHVKCNNKYLPDFNPEHESVFLGYFDANNLYGYSMSKPLPYGGFQWVNPNSIGNISDLPKDGNVGYIIECDFEYPETLHDHHYDLPLLAKSELPPEGKHPKLMMTLKNKERYVAHYWVVQQAIELGLRVTKVHRVIKFSQSTWLKTYIDSNTRRRTAATSAFQKDFFKLMNNSVFGKCLENKRKHKNVKLVTDAKKLEKLVRQPNFQTSIIINENLVAVCMGKTKIVMDRPLYVGMCILDISKTHMYDFHYNKMVAVYGRENIGIAYMDTDAFIYWIKTLDMYEDLRTFEYKDDFDFSDYPRDHPSFDKGVNKKVLGKFKDETNAVPIEEIVALMAKLYALKLFESRPTEGKGIIKKAKGIKNIYLKKNLKFNDYKECLFKSKEFTAKYNTIRSFNHQLYSITEVKKALSSHDNKRMILEDGIHTLPFGHYSLNPIDQ